MLLALRHVRAQGARVPPLTIDMRSAGDGLFFQTRDWSMAEPWGTWTDGARPGLLIALAPGPPRDWVLEFELAHVMVDAERYGFVVKLEVNAHFLASWWVSLACLGPSRRLMARIPAHFGRASGLMMAVLHLDDPRSPASMGRSGDLRRLGLGVRQVLLQEAGP